MIKIVVAGNRSPLFLVNQYKGLAKSDLFSSNACAARAADQGVNDDQFGLVGLHQLDELGIALELPVGLNKGLIVYREVVFGQLFLELNQRLIAIEQQDRPLLALERQRHEP